MQQRFYFIVLMFSILGCAKPTFQTSWTKEQAPDTFTARFETSRGNFDVEVNRSLSPQAVDRFYQTLRHDFYDNQFFYRVVPNFVAQFGNTDTIITRKWEKVKIEDEPVKQSNLRATVSYARSGPGTRGNDLFVNLKDNSRLDTLNYEGVLGFPVIGKVISGMEVVDSLYAGYGNKTMELYDSLSADRNKYRTMFPKMDSIRRAYILKRK